MTTRHELEIFTVQNAMHMTAAQIDAALSPEWLSLTWHAEILLTCKVEALQ